MFVGTRLLFVRNQLFSIIVRSLKLHHREACLASVCSLSNSIAFALELHGQSKYKSHFCYSCAGVSHLLCAFMLGRDIIQQGHCFCCIMLLNEELVVDF